MARVEVKGHIIKDSDKWTCEKMRIEKAWKWQKKDSVALSIFSAELCIEEFEKVFPKDNRPRKAIEAAKAWLENPTEENRSAARSARSAESAAESAARSARSAESAARSARSAESAALDEINSWIVSHTKDMEGL